MIVMDRIHVFLMKMPKAVRREMLRKMQRTVIWFKNGAQVVALPNPPDLLRGYSASMVICDEAAFFVRMSLSSIAFSSRCFRPRRGL